MNKTASLATIALVLGFSLPAEAQQRYRGANANSTPYMVPRFQPGPVPGYVRNLGSIVVRRYYAPVTRQFVQRAPGIVRNFVTGGVGTAGTVAAGSAAFGGAMLNFALPSTAYAPGVGTSTPPWMRRQ